MHLHQVSEAPTFVRLAFGGLQGAGGVHGPRFGHVLLEEGLADGGESGLVRPGPSGLGGHVLVSDLQGDWGQSAFSY